jgi:hypothetical protein
MLLTTAQINRIFKDFSGQPVTLEKLNELYKCKIDNYVYFICKIDFRRGRDYEYDGLLTTNQYEKVMDLFKKYQEIRLGEINGKHSDVTADLNDFSFFFGSCFTDLDIVENYISINGTRTDYDYFLEHFPDEED